MILKDTNCGEPLGGLLRVPKPLAGILVHRRSGFLWLCGHGKGIAVSPVQKVFPC
jgi:hypothetical protein